MSGIKKRIIANTGSLEESFVSWYSPSPGSKSSADVFAKEIFAEATGVFKSELSKDKTKAQWIVDSKAGNLEEVLVLIIKAELQYKTDRGDSVIRRKLSSLASRVHYYGGIMDVLVQQHPEYVSLVWGAMKFLLVGVINHKQLLLTLSSGLCMIADSLPRIDVTAKLYPTYQVKQAAVALYAHILQFLIRALHWYQESRLSRALHSITRPSELRYNDLIQKISDLTHNIDALAVAGSHAEQRDMHNEQRHISSEQEVMQSKIDNLTALVNELKETVITHHTIATSAQIEFRESLSDIQLTLFINFVSPSAILDPTKRYQSSILMRNIRRRKSSDNPAFWLAPKMRFWNQSSTSSLIIIRGTYKNRHTVRDFCTTAIEALLNAQTLTLWILSTIDDQNSTQAQISTIDLLKSLISQAIRLNKTIHTDITLYSRLKAYNTASSEIDWFNILGSVLQGLPLVYIFIDIEIVSHAQLAEFSEGFTWPDEFMRLFSALSERGTTLKVVLVSYGSPVFREGLGKKFRDLVVPVDNPSRTVRRKVISAPRGVNRMRRFVTRGTWD